MRPDSDRALTAKVTALEYALGLAFALLYEQGKYPREAISDFHSEILQQASTISVPAPDPAEADVRSAEFVEALTAMLRSFEAGAAFVGRAASKV